MKKYTPQIVMSATLMGVSVCARLLLDWTPFQSWFPSLMWLHIALIALTLYGIVVIYTARAPVKTSFLGFVRGLPVWLLVLALPALVAVVSLAREEATTQAGFKGPQGVLWQAEGGRYYYAQDNQPKVEVSEANFRAGLRQAYAIFADGWIIFSYVLLILWSAIRRREELTRSG